MRVRTRGRGTSTSHSLRGCLCSCLSRPTLVCSLLHASAWPTHHTFCVPCCITGLQAADNETAPQKELLSLSGPACRLLAASLTHLTQLEFQGSLAAPHPSSLSALSLVTGLKALVLTANADDPVARLGLHCLPTGLTGLTLQVRQSHGLVGWCCLRVGWGQISPARCYSVGLALGAAWVAMRALLVLEVCRLGWDASFACIAPLQAQVHTWVPPHSVVSWSHMRRA